MADDGLDDLFDDDVADEQQQPHDEDLDGTGLAGGLMQAAEDADDDAAEADFEADADEAGDLAGIGQVNDEDGAGLQDDDFAEGDDDVQQQQQIQDDDQGNLFGDNDVDDDDEGADDGNGRLQQDENAAVDDNDEAALFGDLEDNMEDTAGAPTEERGPPIDVNAPLLPRPRSDQVLLMKVPNILRIEPRPWDPATFDGGYEETVDERGVRRVRPRDINVVRWRLRATGGEEVQESNARYVKWSDGSESIVLGDEVLDIDRKDHGKSHTYLYAVRYDVIEGQAHLNKRVTVAPASLHSKLHKRLKMTVQQASQKQDKVRIHLAAKNPEQEKADAEKRAEEAARLKAAQDRAMVRAAPRVPRRPPAFTAAYLEAEDEDDYGGGGGGWGGAGRDEDDELLEDDRPRRHMAEEEELAAARRLQKAKLPTPPPAVGSRKRGYDDDEEAEEAAPDHAKAAAGIKVRRGAILDDDDD